MKEFFILTIAFSAVAVYIFLAKQLLNVEDNKTIENNNVQNPAAVYGV